MAKSFPLCQTVSTRPNGNQDKHQSFKKVLLMLMNDAILNLFCDLSPVDLVHFDDYYFIYYFITEDRAHERLRMGIH